MVAKVIVGSKPAWHALERFVAAQDRVHAAVCEELAAGRAYSGERDR